MVVHFSSSELIDLKSSLDYAGFFLQMYISAHLPDV